MTTDAWLHAMAARAVFVAQCRHVRALDEAAAKAARDGTGTVAEGTREYEELRAAMLALDDAWARYWRLRGLDTVP